LRITLIFIDQGFTSQVSLGGLLAEYDIKSHVASDIGTQQKFLNPALIQTPSYISDLETWTQENKMRLNASKTNYMIFNRTRESFETRLAVEGQWMERKKSLKLLGVWLDEDGGWSKNTQELCKRAYSRLSMLSKLRYAGVSMEDLILIYKMHIRSCLEYCAVLFHSSLSSQQEAALERCQAVCLRVILAESYVSYDAALEMSGLTKLAERRNMRCKDFAKKCIKHQTNKRMFPLNVNESNTHEVRNREKYIVNFAHTSSYKNSTIPFCQRLLNSTDGQDARTRSQG